jgi:hypothetical protein
MEQSFTAGTAHATNLRPALVPGWMPGAGCRRGVPRSACHVAARPGAPPPCGACARRRARCPRRRARRPRRAARPRARYASAPGRSWGQRVNTSFARSHPVPGMLVMESAHTRLKPVAQQLPCMSLHAPACAGRHGLKWTPHERCNTHPSHAMSSACNAASCARLCKLGWPQSCGLHRCQRRPGAARTASPC